MRYITEEAVAEALPDEPCFIRRYVEYAAEQTEAHLGLHLASGLTALAQAAPIDLHLPLFGTRLNANVYSLIVAPSRVGRKTTSIKISGDIIRGAQEWRDAQGRTVFKEVIAPTPGSAEALIDAFADNPKQLLLYEEFGAFLQASNGDAGTNSFAKLRTAMTDAYDGTSLGRSTVRQKRRNVTNPRLSILAGVNREYLEGYTATIDWTAGFLARFFTMYIADEFYSSGNVRKRSLTSVDQDARRDVIQHFLSIATRLGYGPCLGLDDDAKSIWSTWEEEREDRAKTASPLVQSAIHGADTSALKIALLLGLDFGRTHEGKPWYISPRELIPAVKMTLLHFDSIEQLGDSIVFASKDMQDRRNVLSAIRAAGPDGIEAGKLLHITSLLAGHRFESIIQTLLAQYEIKIAVVNNKKRFIAQQR